MPLKLFTTIALIASPVLASPLAVADSSHPVVPPKADMLARADGLGFVDPRAYEDCLGGSCWITFKTESPYGGYFCDMFSLAQTAQCVSITEEHGGEPDASFVSAGEGELGGGSYGERPTPERLADAETLPDRSKIAFGPDGDQVECWTDGPILGCRTPQNHGFALYHNGGEGW